MTSAHGHPGNKARVAQKLAAALDLMHPLMNGAPAGLRRAVASRVALSRAHGFLYFRIPKAANSTIARTLALHAYPQLREAILADETGEYAKTLFHGVWASGCLTVPALQRRYFTFSFFRNPYTRVLSAFLDKIEASNEKYDAIRARMRAGHGPAIDFATFVSYLEQGGLYANIHWAPQTEICPLPVSSLDYVGQIERLDEGLARIMPRIFGELAYQGVATRNHQRRHATDRAAAFYTDDLRARVHALYRNDFEQLGYDAGL